MTGIPPPRTSRPLQCHGARSFAIFSNNLPRVNPSAKFLCVSGASLSGADTTAGADVTSDVISYGWFTQPVESTGLMLRTGGGDTPVKAQDVTFGIGLRF